MLIGLHLQVGKQQPKICIQAAILAKVFSPYPLASLLLALTCMQVWRKLLSEGM